MLRRGVVESFDPIVGLGWVTCDEGRRYPFHCTQIAGGTRVVDSGAAVEFTVVAGNLGRWEAAGVRPC